MVLTDTSSGLEESVLRAAASELEEQEVEIIAVSIGNESDVSELVYVTPHKSNIIDASIDEDPNSLSSEILRLILTGWLIIPFHSRDLNIDSPYCSLLIMLVLRICC